MVNPGVILAGTASGVGKTVATLVVLRALQNAGFDPRPAKAGPDFIDPSHHEAITGHPSRTLDPWLQGTAGMRRTYCRDAGDCRIVEGVMGLYDGDTSTAKVAVELELPVILVVDASAGMESVAATALGFKEYSAHSAWNVDVKGVIAQQAHGGRHESGIRNALPEEIDYVGRIPPLPELEIPERHLGLHLGEESPVPTGPLDKAAETIEIDVLVELLEKPTWDKPADQPIKSTNTRVAVPVDRAFAFMYPTTYDRLSELGNVVTFSFFNDDDLPACDAVYLPGGYPERFAADISGSPALESLSSAAVDGIPIFGECGGMMILGEQLKTLDGSTYGMAGILPAKFTMHERYQALDHIELISRNSSIIAVTGDQIRGHEFHYSSASVSQDASFLFEVTRGTGIDGDHEGLTEYHTLGTYSHVHPESGVFDRFMKSGDN